MAHLQLFRKDGSSTLRCKYIIHSPFSIEKMQLQPLQIMLRPKQREDNVDHRIAIVGFASVSGNGNNSEILTLAGDNSGSVGVSYAALTEDDSKYVGALQDMSTTAGQNMVNSAIAALAAEGATRVDIGMEMANKVFEKNPVPSGETRNRVIVVFTDGVPTTSNSYSETVANSAISYGSTAKSTYGATVYTVGIFDGADSKAKTAIQTAMKHRKLTGSCIVCPVIPHIHRAQVLSDSKRL